MVTEDVLYNVALVFSNPEGGGEFQFIFFTGLK